MNTETKMTKGQIAKRIAKFVVTHSTSATAGSLIKQNVHVEGKLANIMLAVGAYGMSLKASNDAWDAVETQIDELTEAFKATKVALDEELKND